MDRIIQKRKVLIALFIPIAIWFAISCSERDVLFPTSKSASIILDTSKYSYFPSGEVGEVSFITSDSAIIKLYDKSTHSAVSVKGFGWIINLDGTYRGIYEKAMVGRMVESNVKADFLDTTLYQNSRIIYSNEVHLNCANGGTCLDTRVFNEIVGLIKLNGEDYHNPDPIGPVGRKTSCVGINHHEAAMCCFNEANRVCDGDLCNFTMSGGTTHGGTPNVTMSFTCCSK